MLAFVTGMALSRTELTGPGHVRNRHQARVCKPRSAGIIDPRSEPNAFGFGRHIDELVGLLERALQSLCPGRIGNLSKARGNGFGCALVFGKYAPFVSTMRATAKAPAPAHRIVRVGASSLTR